MSAPADNGRELSFDELLGQLLALLGRDVRVAAGELAVSGRLASLPLEHAPAELQRRAIERSLYGFTVRQDGAFWLERRRVRKVLEDRFGRWHAAQRRQRPGPALDLAAAGALGGSPAVDVPKQRSGGVRRHTRLASRHAGSRFEP